MYHSPPADHPQPSDLTSFSKLKIRVAEKASSSRVDTFTLAIARPLSEKPSNDQDTFQSIQTQRHRIVDPKRTN